MKIVSVLLSTFIFSLFVNSVSNSATSSIASHVAIEQVRGPFPGYLFKPKGNQRHPALILLHGSE